MNENKRISSIDFLKGVAVVFVVFTHHNWSNEQRVNYLFPFWIEMAVPIFMIISGYVYSLSFEKKQINKIEDAYNYKILLDKIIRYSIPFIIAMTVEMIKLVIVDKMSLLSFFSIIITGGYGPGSYYFPVMIQFIFVFPVIYFIIKKYDFFGLLICGILNFSYECIKRFYGMPTGEYRLLIFRYLLLIAYGCFLVIGKKKINRKTGLFSIVIGVIWLCLFNYYNYEPIFINKEWAGTSLFSAFYAMPLFYCLINNKYLNNKKTGIVEKIGKASYNIYLTQMVWFSFGSHLIYKISNCDIVIALLNIVVCVVFGLLFYKIESIITANTIKKVRNADYCSSKLYEVVKKINK